MLTTLIKKNGNLCSPRNGSIYFHTGSEICSKESSGEKIIGWSFHNANLSPMEKAHNARSEDH
jgi:hypothetical protein